MIQDRSFAVKDKDYPTFIPNIKVIGLGGAGSNAIGRMMTVGIPGVEYIIANTDRQALSVSNAPVKLQIGPRVTRGLGAGGKAEIGREAAIESKEAIKQALEGADLVFIAAGMGGGTGTGSAPVVASIAREIGALTVAVVTTPFMFEGSFRFRTSQAGIKALERQAHTLITVQNDKLLEFAPRDLRLEVAFCVADDVLRQGIQGIVELVSQNGLVNLDFASVASVILQGGHALMSLGQGEGPTSMQDAAELALNHPLLDHELVRHATSVLVHVTGGADMELAAINTAVSNIVNSVHPSADVLFGASEDPEMLGRAQVILIAAGVYEKPREAIAVQSLFGVPAPNSVEEDDDFGIYHDPNSLDIPAFLRNRDLNLEMSFKVEESWAAV